MAYYMFYKYDGKQKDVMLKGIVQIAPIAGEDDVEVLQVIPEDYRPTLEAEVYGGDFDMLALLPPPEVFNPRRADHWRALTNIFHMHGYGGVVEYTDEEFLAFAKENGYEEPNETD